MHIDPHGYVLPIAPALLDLLRQPLQLLLCPPQQRLIVEFRDPDYDPVADAGADRYPVVEIAINGAGRLQWITAFAYPDADGVTELGRELDFDFARGIFQHWGSCQPLLQGAAIFQWWQAHFLHAARNGVFAIQVQTP